MKMLVKIDAKTYQVEIEDIHARPVIALVDGERYEVWPEDNDIEGLPKVSQAPDISIPTFQQSITPVTLSGQASSGNDVLSPLPGVIVALLVKPGDNVEHGQELCTLEAMKMKNAIRSNRQGTIASVEVNVGDQVNHGQVLLSFEG